MRPAHVEDRRTAARQERVPSFRIGSEEHKRLLCGLMLDSHDPYDPARLRWPDLDADSRARLKALPFWNVALETEDGATRDLEAMAAIETDPLLRRAIALQAFEERRHRHVLEGLTRAYDIQVAAADDYVQPPDPEWAFLRTGYGECFDSFFAFGLFAVAKQSGFFNPALVDVFEPVIQEEARHIVFFVNWVAYCRATTAPLQRPAHAWRCLSAFTRQAWRRVKTAKSVGGGAEGKDFTFESHKSFSVDLSPRGFFQLCVSENARRMAGYDERLLRPRFMPTAIGLLSRVLPRAPESLSTPERP
jgi:hypothetical protein